MVAVVIKQYFLQVFSKLVQSLSKVFLMPWIFFILVTKNSSTANTKELSVERAKMSDYRDSEMPSSKWAPLTLPQLFSFASASTQLTLIKNKNQ